MSVSWKWFVGLRDHGAPVMFADIGKPTQAKYPQFYQVVGPFQSEENAFMYISEAYRFYNPSQRRKKNPGASWHRARALEALQNGKHAEMGSYDRGRYHGQVQAHNESANEASRLGINPKRRRRNPPTVIYENIEAIDAEKGDDSLWPKEKFRHEFKRGTQVLGMKDGSILIKSKKGKKLWKEFDY